MNDHIEVKYKANVPLLAKAMLEGKSIGFHDITGHSRHGRIMGIRAEGGTGLWLIKIKDGEYCVRCMDGGFNDLSKWAV